jgi:peptide/nickel transport system permease protein
VKDPSSLAALTARRLVGAVPLAVGVATVVFLMVQLVPGEPFDELAGPGTDPETLDHLRNLLGSDRPLGERYVRWLADLATGDLGLSTAFRRPVRELLASAVQNTLLLAGLAVALQFCLGLACGYLACLGRDGWVDRGVRAVAGLVYATPAFVIAVVLVGVFAVRLGWLPASQMRSIDHDTLPLARRFLDDLRHLVLPCLALALPGAGAVALYVREELAAVLDRPFLRAARSLGFGRARVLLRHAMRNALLPVVHLLGLSVPGLVGGSVVVETIFGWPGMGRLAWQAVMSRDAALVLGCTLVAALGVIVGNLAADLLAAAVDPRTREAR